MTTNRTRWLFAIICTALGFATAYGEQRLLVTSFLSDRIGQYDATTGEYLGDFASGAELDGPLATRVGPDGLLYVASELTNTIVRYRVDSGEMVDTFITGGGSVPLAGPSGITWSPEGDLYVSSFENDSILRFDGETGDFVESVITAGGLVDGPDNGTIFGPDGRLYIPSYFTNQIVRYDPASGESETFVQTIARPRVLVFHGDELYATSESTQSVRRYNPDGSLIEFFIRDGILDQPVGLERHDDGWSVTSASSDRVLKFDDDGMLIDASFIAAGLGGIDAPVFITAVTVPEPSAWVLGFSTMVAVFWCIRHRRDQPQGSA